MGSSLTGQKINQTYDALLKVSDNGALDGTLQTITDGLGNDSALSLSTAGASVGGTLAVSGNAAFDTNTLFVDAANNRVLVGGTTADGNWIPKFSVISSASDGSEGLSIESYRPSLIFRDYSAAAVRQHIVADSSNLLFGSGDAAFTEKARIASNGDISFRDSSANEAFYWDASAASLGIGVQNPSSKLMVLGNGSVPFRWGDSSALGTLTFAGVEPVIQSNSGQLLFYMGSTEKMRIDSSGNVGIGGTADSSYKLHLYGSGSSEMAFEATGAGGGFFRIGAGTTASGFGGALRIYDVNAATERMRITSGGYLKASNTGSYLNATGTFHELTSSSGNSSVLLLRHLDVTNPYGLDLSFSASSPNDTTRYFIAAADSTTLRFRVYSNGNVVNSNNSYGAISDAKLKENIVDASPKLEDLMQVQVRNFNYIGDDKKQLGVVAQELEQVFPSMIDESPDYEEVEVPQLDENGQEVLDENGEVVMTKEKFDLGTVTKSVKYSVFVPMLIKAIQELNAKVESLEAQLNA